MPISLIRSKMFMDFYNAIIASFVVPLCHHKSCSSSVQLVCPYFKAMTEGTMLLIVDFPHKRPGSIGRAVKGCKVRIHQPDKEEVGEVRWRKIWVSTACNLKFFYNYVFFWSARNCSLEKKMLIFIPAWQFSFNGRNIFMGYLNNEKTGEIIDDDGWLHSGDAGKIHEVPTSLWTSKYCIDGLRG